MVTYLSDVLLEFGDMVVLPTTDDNPMLFIGAFDIGEWRRYIFFDSHGQQHVAPSWRRVEIIARVREAYG